MSSAKVTDKVTYKISPQIFSISQREAYPFLLKLGQSDIKPIKGINFKEFKELKKVLFYSRAKYFKILYNFTKNLISPFLCSPRYFIRILNFMKIG